MATEGVTTQGSSEVYTGTETSTTGTGATEGAPPAEADAASGSEGAAQAGADAAEAGATTESGYVNPDDYNWQDYEDPAEYETGTVYDDAAVADPDAPVNQNSTRDQLLQDLYNKMNGATQQGNQALQQQNGEQMISAAEQLADVIEQAQLSEADVRQEMQENKEAQKEYKEYVKLLSQSTSTFRLWQQQSDKIKTWKSTDGTTADSETLKGELASVFTETRRRSGEFERQRQQNKAETHSNDQAKDKYSALNQILMGVKGKALTPQEKTHYQKLAKEEGHLPQAGVLAGSSFEKKVAKAGEKGLPEAVPNKDLKLEAEKRDFQKTQEQKTADATAAENAEQAADVSAENRGLTLSTNKESLKASYVALKKQGMMAEEDFKVRMQDLEAMEMSDFTRKYCGAGMMAAASGEQADQLQFQAYRAQFLEQQTVEKREGNSEENAYAFERMTFGMQHAVEKGYGYQAAKRASFKAISAAQNFAGSPEEGLHKLNTLVAKGKQDKWVSSSEDDPYTHNYTKLKQKAEAEGFVPAREFQATDPDSVV